MTGTVKWFNDAKGFGFIASSDPRLKGKDCFAHYSDLSDGLADGSGRKTLSEGQAVEFDLESSPRGARARNVRPAA
jgi:CspA family cold shock protein